LLAKRDDDGTKHEETVTPTIEKEKEEGKVQSVDQKTNKAALKIQVR